MTASTLLQDAYTALIATGPLELVAVILGIVYLVLASKEHIACWYAAFVGTAIYLVLFWQVSLLMESVLQLYYLAMAVYGWWQWRGGKQHHNTLAISRFSTTQHVITIVSVLTLTAASATLLERYTNAALPWLDAFTTWGAVATTWMVTRKILENWLYWLVIDSVSLYLYIERGLALTAVLFAAYLVIVVFGYFQWRKQYQQQLHPVGIMP